MNAAWIDPSFSLRFATTLLHFLWEGCIIAAVVVAGGILSRRAPAQWRYVLNVAALLLMAACLPATFAVLGSPDGVPAVLSEQPPATPLTVETPDADAESQRYAVTDAAVVATETTHTEIVIDGLPPQESEAAPISGSVARIAPFLTLIYFFGVALMLIRMAAGLRGGHRLRQTAIPIDDNALLATIRRQARQIGLRCAPATAWCREISIPVVVGIVQPMVLLPAALAAGLSPDQVRALVTHELAHIRRLDLLVNMLQRLIEAALFFHPAVWFVSRCVSTERENATDDMVLAAGWRPPQYADALLRMAELSSALRKTSLAHQAATLAASGTNPSDFKRRILRLVDGPEPTSFRLTRGGLAALAVMLLVSLSIPIAMRAPAQSPADDQPAEESNVPVAALDEESPPGVTIDKTLLSIVADSFSPETKVLGNYVTGGGIIERIEDDTFHFRSGDRIEVAEETWLVVPRARDQPLRRVELEPQLLEPGMAISYSMRDGRIEEVVLTGIVAQPPTGESVFDTIEELGLRRGSEMSTSLDGRFPMRVTGKDGPVLIAIGQTKLIELPEPTMIVEWQIGDYQPEGIEDFEPFDYLLVQWRENGRITWTCYQSPEIAGGDDENEPPPPEDERSVFQELIRKYEQALQAGAAAEAERTEERRAVLREAASFYERFYQQHRSELAGLWARFQQARCLRKLGDEEQADTILRDLLELAGESEELEELKGEIEAVVQNRDTGEQRAAAHDLVATIEAEWERARERFEIGHAYGDKVTFASEYDEWKERVQPAPDEITAMRERLTDWYDNQEAEPGLTWRIRAVRAPMLVDEGDHEAAHREFDAALEAYPVKDYPSPSQFSYFHHLANQKAMLVWDDEGLDEAVGFFAELLARDSRCHFFFAAPWRKRLESEGNPQAWSTIRAAVLEAYEQRAREFPEDAAEIRARAAQLRPVIDDDFQ